MERYLFLRDSPLVLPTEMIFVSAFTDCLTLVTRFRMASATSLSTFAVSSSVVRR